MKMMKASLLAITMAAALGVLSGATSVRTEEGGACDLSSVLSGFWCSPCQKAFEPDVVADHEYTCPDCGRTLETCEICVKRISEGNRERTDVARVIYRCDVCGAQGDSEGPCPSCSFCGRRVRTCSKSGTAPHVAGRSPS